MIFDWFREDVRDVDRDGRLPAEETAAAAVRA
jgi:hypothetical protein